MLHSGSGDWLLACTGVLPQEKGHYLCSKLLGRGKVSSFVGIWAKWIQVGVGSRKKKLGDHGPPASLHTRLHCLCYVTVLWNKKSTVLSCVLAEWLLYLYMNWQVCICRSGKWPYVKLSNIVMFLWISCFWMRVHVFQFSIGMCHLHIVSPLLCLKQSDHLVWLWTRWQWKGRSLKC